MMDMTMIDENTEDDNIARRLNKYLSVYEDYYGTESCGNLMSGLMIGIRISRLNTHVADVVLTRLETACSLAAEMAPEQLEVASMEIAGFISEQDDQPDLEVE